MTSIKSKRILNNGIEMPNFGFGTYLINNPETIRYAVVEQNYCLLDTAEYYENEKEVGKAMKLTNKPREEIFVTSKLFDTSPGRDGCIKTFKQSLKDLDTPYIDQYLLHAPQGGKVLECYDTLLEFVKNGLLKSVGVSNFGVKHLEAIKKSGRPLPTVNQIELHPWCTNEDIVKYCNENNIAVVAYGPLTRDNRLNDPNLAQLGNKYSKSPAQILLRWSIQKGFIPIPKSDKRHRIDENANVFDFSLSDDDINFLDSLGRKNKVCYDWDPTLNPMSSFGPEK